MSCLVFFSCVLSGLLASYSCRVVSDRVISLLMSHLVHCPVMSSLLVSVRRHIMQHHVMEGDETGERIYLTRGFKTDNTMGTRAMQNAKLDDKASHHTRRNSKTRCSLALVARKKLRLNMPSYAFGLVLGLGPQNPCWPPAAPSQRWGLHRPERRRTQVDQDPPPARSGWCLPNQAHGAVFSSPFHRSFAPILQFGDR